MTSWRAGAPRSAVASTLAVILIAACGSSAWPKTAGETSCAEWTNQMTSIQRESIGAAMLIALQASDGASVRPPGEVIVAFRNAITDVCEANPDQKVSAVGATIYSLSDDLKP